MRARKERAALASIPNRRGGLAIQRLQLLPVSLPEALQRIFSGRVRAPSYFVGTQVGSVIPFADIFDHLLRGSQDFW